MRVVVDRFAVDLGRDDVLLDLLLAAFEFRFDDETQKLTESFGGSKAGAGQDASERGADLLRLGRAAVRFGGLFGRWQDDFSLGWPLQSGD